MSKAAYILKVEETIKQLHELKQKASVQSFVVGDSKVGLSMSIHIEASDISTCAHTDFIMVSSVKPMEFTEQFALIAKAKFSKAYSGTLSIFTSVNWYTLRIANFESVLSQMKGSANV